MTATSWLASACCAIAACTPATATEATTTVASANFVGCGGLCPTNSPVVDIYGFHDLNKLRVRNSAGLAVHGFLRDGKRRPFDVRNGRLIVVDGKHEITGPKLVGGALVLDDQNGTSYAIKVEEVVTGHYWADPQPELELYRLSWATMPPGGGLPDPQSFLHVCPDPVDENDALGMPTFFATLYEGDRIDAERLTVYAVERDWFNLGCAGHAVAKLALTGHTEAARSVGFETELFERQAMLKMLSADYCGLGIPFTVPGQPLGWHDDHGWLHLPSPPPGATLAIEARWTDAGASCLDQPRVDAHPGPTTLPMFGDSVADDIKLACEPPPCSDGDLFEFYDAHLISANLP